MRETTDTDLPDRELLQHLAAIVGPSGLVTGADLRARPASWKRPADPCAALALVRPRDTAQTAAVMAACHEAGRAVVPRGGATGLVDGILCAPDEITLSTERMTEIEPVDPIGMTVTAGTGATVEAIQTAAHAAGLFFPLDLGARGSATVGGTLSTNAGGLRVLRYGMMREMVLGLEAVLADGTVVSSMRPLIKNNTGLDLKQLFIGTEGTLGIVTRAVLRLRPEPAGHVTALIACPGVDAGARVLRAAQAAFQGRVSSFEGLWPAFYRLMTAPGRAAAPLAHGHPFYAIIEVECVPDEEDRFHVLLEGLMNEGAILDAALASSEEQRQAMWRIRDRVEHMNTDGLLRSFDVSLPLARMDAYVRGVLDRFDAIPGCRAVVFGHIGDNNLHWNVTRLGAAGDAAVDAALYEPLAELNGSVSAEHGIGLEKRSKLALSRSPDEVAVMRLVKRALDPGNRLNPGKIFA